MRVVENQGMTRDEFITEFDYEFEFCDINECEFSHIVDLGIYESCATGDLARFAFYLPIATKARAYMEKHENRLPPWLLEHSLEEVKDNCGDGARNCEL
jgi:hypothetical protein